jgi:hypothetical protein
VLKAVRRARGIETAVRCAEEMIVATVSIIAPRAARNVRAKYANSLPRVANSTPCVYWRARD